MTDYEFIKALEGCWLEGNCEYCPMKKDNKCKAILRQIAIDLINRQQAEIERLKDILYDADGVNLVNYWHQQCKIAENGCRNLAEENETLKAEIERLQKENNQFADIGKLYSEIKVEAIRYALEWLQAHQYINHSPERRKQLVKEMVGDTE